MKKTMNSAKVWCVVVLGLACGSALAEDNPVSPYRPSVSSPAQLPATGQLELELGGLAMHDDGMRRESLPMLLKLAFSDSWGVLLGTEALVQSRTDDGQRVRGLGDTTLTLKHAHALSEASALGLELTAKLPTARDVIGSGKADYTVNGIYSSDMGSVHGDFNLNLTRLGLIEPDSGRIQRGASASFSMPLAEHWSGTAELSGTARRGAGNTAQLLVAGGYSPSKRLTFDLGLAHGLNKNTTDWQVFGGVVLPITQLW